MIPIFTDFLHNIWWRPSSLLENLGISEPSLSILEKFKCHSDVLHRKYKILGQNFLISSKKTNITKVPSGCNTGEKQIQQPNTPCKNISNCCLNQQYQYFCTLEKSANITSISAPTLKIIIGFEWYVCWDIYPSNLQSLCCKE